jgi:exonuclease III
MIFYTQNVNGLKRSEKIDHIIDRMRRQNVDVYLVQETWLEGDGQEFQQLEIGDYTAIFHGNSEPTCSRGRGGVAIFLSKKGKRAWEKAGANKPVLSGTVSGCARWMGIELETQESKRIFAITAYHPHSGMDAIEIDNFYQRYDDFLDSHISEDTTVIIGCDTNSPLGVAQSEEDEKILGPKGDPYSRNDETDQQLRNLVRKHDLRASTTDYQHNRYDTWYSEGLRAVAQLDYFLVSNNARPSVMDAKRVGCGIESDHAAVKLKVRLNQDNRGLAPRAALKPINWRKMQTPEVAISYARSVDELMDEKCRENNVDKPNIKVVNDAMIQAARKAIPEARRTHPDWFRMNEKELHTAIEKRDTSYNNASKHKEDDEAQHTLRTARAELRRTVKSSKRAWQTKVAEEATNKAFKKNPREAWEAIRTIQDSFTGHHRQSTQVKMRMQNGELAQTDEQNADVFHPHFDKIFNGQSPTIDIPAAVGLIRQRNIMYDLDAPIELAELEEHIRRASNEKAPGESLVTAEALKNLNPETVQVLLKLVNEFLDGSYDPEEWHAAVLKVLFKKGDASNPTNWRGICLKDMTARITSAILCTRLTKVIQAHGVETQYGSQPKRGTQDGLFVLRSALSTRRYHNQPTWTLFVDLVKAFDTANHQLLFEILRRYGVPPKVVKAVETLYTDVTVKLQMGKAKRTIPYTIGVQQGDNMAPILFVFLMQAFAESLEEKWKTEWGMDSPQYRYMVSQRVQRGRLLGQDSKAVGVSFDLLYLLYVDDGAFLFETLEEMTRGANYIHDHFRTFGLKMHIGRDGGKSKTECVYFPASLKAELYQQIDMEQKIPVKDGYVTLTRQFKYLGSWIHETLKDDYEIDIRIGKARQQIGALKAFFKCPAIPIHSKYRIYCAIPLNTVLWGCESWSLTEQAKRRLSAYHHTSIRSILGINIHHVEKHHIKNETIRQWLCDAPDIIDVIHRRQLQWIGKVMQMDDTRAPPKLMMSWTKHPRKPGRPQNTYRNSYAQAIHQILPTCNPIAGIAKTWAAEAKDEEGWKASISNWWRSKAQPPGHVAPPRPPLTPPQPRGHR